MERTTMTTGTTRGDDISPGRSTAGRPAKGTKVPVRAGQQTLLDRIREVQDRITRRAFEIFQANGAREGSELEDWLAAERELFWKPSFDLSEQDGTLTLRAAVAGMEPEDLEVTVTPDRLVLTGRTQHHHEETRGTVHYTEFSQGSLYREIAFPHPVDPAAVTATLRNGLLEIVAPGREEAAESDEGRVGRQTIEVARA